MQEVTARFLVRLHPPRLSGHCVRGEFPAAQRRLGRQKGTFCGAEQMQRPQNLAVINRRVCEMSGWDFGAPGFRARVRTVARLGGCICPLNAPCLGRDVVDKCLDVLGEQWSRKPEETFALKAVCKAEAPPRPPSFTVGGWQTLVCPVVGMSASKGTKRYLAPEVHSRHPPSELS